MPQLCIQARTQPRFRSKSALILIRFGSELSWQSGPDSASIPIRIGSELSWQSSLHSNSCPLRCHLEDALAITGSTQSASRGSLKMMMASMSEDGGRSSVDMGWRAKVGNGRRPRIWTERWRDVDEG